MVILCVPCYAWSTVIFISHSTPLSSFMSLAGIAFAGVFVEITSCRAVVSKFIFTTWRRRPIACVVVFYFLF